MIKLRELKPRHYILAIALGLAAAWLAYDEGDDDAVVDAPQAPGMAAATPSAPGGRDAAPAPGANLIQTSSAAATTGSGMQQAAIIDAHGFDRPMPAYVLEVPAGWQAAGELSWNLGGCTAVQRSIRFRAMAPDGLQGVEILPAWYSKAVQPDATFTAPGAGCAAMPFAGVRDYLNHMATQRHPEGRVLDYADRPDLVAEAEGRNPLPPLPQTQAMRSRWYREAAQVLVGWNQNGREMREVIVALALLQDDQVTMPMIQSSRGDMATRAEQARSITVPGAMAYQAPDGQLDMALLERIRSSIRPSPEWDARVARSNQEMMQARSQSMTEGHNARMAAIQAAGAANTRAHNARMATMDANHQAWMANQATSNRMQQRTLGAIGEYNTYQGSDGNPVQSSIHGGARVFQNETTPSQVFSTDDPYASPPPGYVELQRTR